MNMTQATKYASDAGLECVYKSIGKVWNAYNNKTGEKVVFDAKMIRNQSDYFKALVDKCANPTHLKAYNVKEGDTGQSYGTIWATDEQQAKDKVAQQYGFDTEADWSSSMYHTSHVVGIGGQDKSHLVVVEVK
jgi:hypothetical protein